MLNNLLYFDEKIGAIYTAQKMSVSIFFGKCGNIIQLISKNRCELPYFSSKVQAGFPSPADDYMENNLDLNEYLIRHPSATFLVRATGDSMIGAGIFENDLMVVDKCINVTDGKIVVAAIEGLLTVKRFKYINKKPYLVAENDKYPPLKIKSESNIHIWGVVTSVIHKFN